MQAAECWGWLKLSLLLWWSYLPHKGLNMFTYLCLFWINTCKLINQSTKTAALKPAGARNKQWNSGLHFIKGLIDLLLYQQFLQPFKKPYWNVFLKIKYSLLHIQGFRTKLRFLLANYSYLFWSGKCEMRNVSSVLGSLGLRSQFLAYACIMFKTNSRLYNMAFKMQWGEMELTFSNMLLCMHLTPVVLLIISNIF